ncbi:potassium channel family protein [Isoptericola sp. b490]|uniref:potassium channel family protein n=1 Tax=Actinotalea lenta TaxID=3064654 RepID=UPI002714084D|nr:potassium channel family protein [Isoptericola sp. b490]MDO8121938.1 potassium channel family protein [Isoptericola sp. b490]
MRVPQLRRAAVWPAVLVSAVVVVVSGGAVAAIETDTVESFWRGLWWSISLVTTVGFLGSPPRTGAGAALSVVLMVVGFVLLAMVSAALASLFVRQDEQPRQAAEREVDRAVLEALASVEARLSVIEARLDDAGGLDGENLEARSGTLDARLEAGAGADGAADEVGAGPD